jgi:hypothetical protein
VGYLFEDLIRRFSEISNETAGEVIRPPDRRAVVAGSDPIKIEDIIAASPHGISTLAGSAPATPTNSQI